MFLIQGAQTFSKISIFTAKLRDILTASSYTSVCHVLTKASLGLRAFPFSFDGRYASLKNSKCDKLPRIIALGAVLCQWIMCYGCLRNQLNSSGTPIWKAVIVTFFLVIFAAVIIFMLHLVRVSNDVVCLLNVSEDVEREYREKG